MTLIIVYLVSKLLMHSLKYNLDIIDQDNNTENIWKVGRFGQGKKSLLQC